MSIHNASVYEVLGDIWQPYLFFHIYIHTLDIHIDACMYTCIHTCVCMCVHVSMSQDDLEGLFFIFCHLVDFPPSYDFGAILHLQGTILQLVVM